MSDKKQTNDQKNNNEKKRTPTEDDDEESSSYFTAASRTASAVTVDDKTGGVPLTRPHAERKSRFELVTARDEDPDDVPHKPLGAERRSRFELVTARDEEPGGVPLRPLGAERRSRFTLVTARDEPRNISDDDDDDLSEEEISTEKKVTNFDDDGADRVGANRTKRFTKTRIDQRDDGPDDVSSMDLHRARSVSRAVLDSRRSGSKLHTNLQAGQIFIYVVVPPDGGYGWFIMVISFLCQVIVDGLVFSIGIVMPYMADDLQVTPAEIVLVVSIQIGCYFLSGPISSAAINKYGFRPVILVGVVISSLSILIATFSPNLPMLIVFYSVIGGPTLSMIWVTSQLIIGYYFEKYRPIAYGISVSGAGAGIVFASALNSAVVDDIGWRNTLRIHAALLTTIFFMGLSFVEVPPTRVAHINEPEFDTETDESEQLLKGQSFRYSRVSSTISTTAADPVATGAATPTSNAAAAVGLDQMLVKYKEPTRRRNCCARCCGKRRKQSTEEDEFNAQRYVVQTDFLERQDVYYMGPVDYNQARHRGTVFDGRPIEIDRNRRATEYTLSVIQTTPRAPVERRKTLKELKTTSRRPCLDYIAPSNWLPAKITNAFRLLFDFRLLAMSEFQILLLSAFFFPMGFNIPFVYSKVRAEIPRAYANYISPSIGLSNFVFRIVSGYIAFKYRDLTTYVCGFGLIFGGLATLISAFYGTDLIWFQYVYAVCYGVAPAFYSTLRAIIYVQALGLEKLTNAFGLTGMAMGLGVFIGTTLAGILNEETDSYSASFAFGGCCMIVAGLLKVLLPPFMKWKEARLFNARHVQFSP